MTGLSSRVFGRAFSTLLVFGAIALAPLGCGEGEKKDGAKADNPPEIKAANENMLNHMKNQTKK